MSSKSVYTKHGLFDVSDGVFRGKGISSLLQSRDRKEELVRLFGGKDNLPSSIMRARKRRSTEENDAVVSGVRSYGKTGYISGDKELQRAFETSARGVRTGRRYGSREKGTVKALGDDSGLRGAFAISSHDVRAGALSTFPQNVGRAVLMLYSDPGDLVFDPFCGHNSRMELCISNGRHYEGYDVSQEFMSFNRWRCKELLHYFPSAKVSLHLCDSRHCQFSKDAGADFTLTSPPYWDVEWYGDEQEQLGRAQTYEEFLDSIEDVLRENFRVLRPGAFAVWFVNDFRRKGTFHLYHMDLVAVAMVVGFVVHDLMVVDFGPGIRDAFTNQIVETKVLPKRHEYGLVFRKPG